MSILVNTGPTTLTKTWYVDGDAVDVGTLTIGIVDANGAEVVAPLTAVTDNSDGTYTYDLAIAAIPEPTVLAVTWTEASTQSQTHYIEVAGGWLFTENAARSFDDNALSNAGVPNYTDEAIAAERDRATDLLETWTHRSWVPRYARIETSGSGTPRLHPNGVIRFADGAVFDAEGSNHDINRVLSVTINGATVAVGNFVVDNSTIYRTNGTFPCGTSSNPLNVVVEYVYGTQPGSGGSTRAGLLVARDTLVASNISDRASSFSDELGTYRFTTPGIGIAVSTLPEVNQWVRDHSHMVPVH